MKSNSTKAFLVVVTLFLLAFYQLGDLANALSIVWVIMLSILLLAILVKRFVVIPKIRNAKIAELGLTPEQAKGNKELDKATKYLARSTFIGELSGYFSLFFIIFIFRSFIYEPFKIPSGSMQPTLEIGDYISTNKHYYRIADPIFQNTIIKLKDVERGDVIVFKSPSDPKSDWIKRVVGLPGDIVNYNEFTRRLTVLQGCKDPIAVAQQYDFEKETLDQLATENGCLNFVFKYGNFFPNQNFELAGELLEERAETMFNSNGEPLTHATLQYPKPIAYKDNTYHKDGLPPLTWVVPEGRYFVMGDNRDMSQDSRFIGFVPYKNIVGKAEYIWFSIKYNQDGSFDKINFPRIFRSIYTYTAKDAINQ